MKKTVLAYGNPVYDIISTPQITRRDRVLSGCSTNACLAASYLGENTILVGTVGSDYEEQLKLDLSNRNISYELHPSKETGGFSLIYYDDQGNRNLSLLGIADPIPVNGSQQFQGVDFILFGPILGEISIELVKNIRRSTNIPVLLDPQGLLRNQENGEIFHELTDVYKEIARMSTIIKANELETRVITGIDDPRANPEKAVRMLYETGGEIAVVTLAEAGSIIFDGKQTFIIPPYKTNAIDPTGAGDTYAAGFMIKYLETPQDLSAVGCFASSVSSVMVENSGPDFPLTREEADKRMQHLLGGPLKLAL